jgi:hypothetical protein
MVREHKIQIQNVTSVQYITIYIVLTTNVLPCLPLHEKKKKKKKKAPDPVLPCKLQNCDYLIFPFGL